MRTEGAVNNPQPSPRVFELDEAIFEKSIQEHGKGNVNKAFKMYQKLLYHFGASIIIAAFDESGNVVGYLGDPNAMSGEWYGFEDDTVAQYPQIFKTYTGIAKRLQKTRDEETSLEIYQRPGKRSKVIRFGLVIWQHPEADYQKLDEYLKMSGIQLKGSPRH